MVVSAIVPLVGGHRARRTPPSGTVAAVATVEDGMKRRSLPVLAAAFALSGLTVLSAASPAYGCSCAETSIESVVDPGTVAAFVGVPVAVMESTGPGRDPGDVYVAPLLWTFEVETVIVGDLAEMVEVGSGYGGGDCGVDFSHTGRVAVVAYGDPGNLTTGSCGGVWDADDFLAVHGPGVPPIPYVGAASEPVDTGPPIWVWWGAAGLVLATAAGVLISRRRTTFQDGWGEAGED